MWLLMRKNWLKGDGVKSSDMLRWRRPWERMPPMSGAFSDEGRGTERSFVGQRIKWNFVEETNGDFSD